jgi:hypothetical protein
MPADPEARLRAALDELADALLALARESRPPADGPVEPLSGEEFVRRAGISRSTAYLALGDGRVRSVRLRSRRLVPASRVDRLVAAPSLVRRRHDVAATRRPRSEVGHALGRSAHE